MFQTFKKLQAKCLKWILQEEELSYSDAIYIRKCRETDILPLKYKFFLNDMVFLHEILCGRSPLQLPKYLNFSDGNSRLRVTHLDALSFVSSLTSCNNGTRNLQKSFFFRSHTLWNSLPFEIRGCCKKIEFKDKLTSYFWEKSMEEIYESTDDWSFSLSDDGG